MVWCFEAFELVVETVDVFQDFFELWVFLRGGGGGWGEDLGCWFEVEREMGVCFEAVFCCHVGGVCLWMGAVNCFCEFVRVQCFEAWFWRHLRKE